MSSPSSTKNMNTAIPNLDEFVDYERLEELKKFFFNLQKKINECGFEASKKELGDFLSANQNYRHTLFHLLELAAGNGEIETLRFLFNKEELTEAEKSETSTIGKIEISGPLFKGKKLTEAEKAAIFSIFKSAFKEAAKNGYEEVVIFLLSLGIHQELSEDDRFQIFEHAFITAAKNRHLNVFRLLFSPELGLSEKKIASILLSLDRYFDLVLKDTKHENFLKTLEDLCSTKSLTPEQKIYTLSHLCYTVIGAGNKGDIIALNLFLTQLHDRNLETVSDQTIRERVNSTLLDIYNINNNYITLIMNPGLLLVRFFQENRYAIDDPNDRNYHKNLLIRNLRLAYQTLISKAENEEEMKEDAEGSSKRPRLTLDERQKLDLEIRARKIAHFATKLHIMAPTIANEIPNHLLNFNLHTDELTRQLTIALVDIFSARQDIRFSDKISSLNIPQIEAIMLTVDEFINYMNEGDFKSFAKFQRTNKKSYDVSFKTASSQKTAESGEEEQKSAFIALPPEIAEHAASFLIGENPEKTLGQKNPDNPYLQIAAEIFGNFLRTHKLALSTPSAAPSHQSATTAVQQNQLSH